LKFTATELRHYYRNVEIQEGPWRFSRKHFRLENLNGKWVKLNHFENRINGRELSKHLVKYVPSHVYMSATDWLFPERVGPKHKARFAVPIGGEFVVDVDSYLKSRPHRHVYDPLWKVCEGCLAISRDLGLTLCDRILENYSQIEIVFSGRRGFHVHVLDFNYRDWGRPNPRNPLKAMSDARFKYALQILPDHDWDHPNFIVSVDPMRVVTVPGTLNADTGLVCIDVGGVGDLADLSIQSLLGRSKPIAQIWETFEELRLP
jgi:hypothetical protein